VTKKTQSCDFVHSDIFGTRIYPERAHANPLGINKGAQTGEGSIMVKKSAGKQVYKVTGTVYVEAKNVRHAAHVAKGTFQMIENGPAIYVVEAREASFGVPYIVDLSKKEGQPGYIEIVPGLGDSGSSEF